MENAVDALKIGFALLVFAIAVALTFSVIGQARVVADIVFQATDKTNFYDYATEESYNTREDRIVSFETMLPTIHRYAKEQYLIIQAFQLFAMTYIQKALWQTGMKQLKI